MTTRTPEQKARHNELERKRYAESPEARARRSEYQRKRMGDPEYRAKHAAYSRTPEARAKAAERRSTPEFRARKAEYNRQYNTPEVRARHAEYLRHRSYGLTPEQHAAMLEAQGGVCAICRGKGGKKGLSVDHCHETGVVRGLLCGNCNTGIGKLGDTPAGLMRAVKYLRAARKRQQLELPIED